MLHFLIGEAYSGKTTALFELTRSLTEQGRRVLFFVPEQQTAETEAALIRFCKNTVGEHLEVLNFQRLPNRIFRELGGLALPCSTQTQNALFLARVLREESERLPLFSRHRKQADFIREMSAFLDELSRSAATPEELLALSERNELCPEETLCEKLRETAHLVSVYHALYREEHGKDPDEATRLLETLRACNGSTFFDQTTVILDGFYDFTAVQYELIRLMASRADEVYLSSLDGTHSSGLFARPRACRRFLQARLDDVDYDEITPRDLGLSERSDKIPEDLAFLCDHILEQPEQLFAQTPAHLTLTECKTPYDEVRRALREIVRLHEEESVAYADCAVLYRDGMLYAPLCKELCRSYAVALYTDSRTPLSDSSLARFLSAAVKLACGDASAETFLSLLSSDLCPVTERAAFLWERYIRTWNLSGKRLLRTEDYTESIFGFDEMITDAMKEENRSTLEIINRQKHKLLRPLLRLKTAFAKAETAAEFTEALYTFAEEVELDSRYSLMVDALGEAGEFSAAAEAEGLFSSANEALASLGAIPSKIDAASYAELLALAFSFGSVGALPSSPEALAAGDITFTRLKKVRHLFLLGVSTDVFPRTQGVDCILSVRERAMLARLAGEDDPLFFAKETASLTLDEYFLFYLAASVPREGLHLSYATQKLDGGVQTPSVFIERVRALFPTLETEVFDPARALPTTPVELYEYLFSKRERDDAFTLIAKDLFRAEKFGTLPLCEEELKQAREKIAPIEVPENITVSQAKLAAYARCPYSYFLQYKLFLSEIREAKLDASLRGTVIHSALEHLLAPLSQGRHFLPKLAELSAEAVEAEFMRRHDELTEAGYVFDPWDERWFSDLKQNTKRLLRSMKEEFAVGTFRPAYFEADLLRTLSPIERILKNGSRMRVSGKADRIDLAEDTATGKIYARVVDYKTGDHALKLDQVLNGFDTQLLLYLFTLAENGLKTQNAEVLPAAAYYLRAHTTPLSAQDADLKKIAADPERDVTVFSRSGVFLSDEDALKASIPKGVSTQTDCVPIRYNSSGLPVSSGLLANEEEMALLKEAVLKFATDTAEDIQDGKFACEPLWEDEEKNDSCTYCPYHSICRYEGDACRIMKKTSKKDFFSDLKEGGIHRG